MPNINMAPIEATGNKPVNTRFGSKQTYSIKIGSEWFKCGFTNPKVSKGNVVSFSWSEGDYGKDIDMKSFKVEGSGGGTATPAATKNEAPAKVGGYAAPAAKVFPVPPNHGDRSIIRQNALNHATALYLKAAEHNSTELKKIDLDIHADRITSLARRFEAYSSGDLDLINARKAVEKELNDSAMEALNKAME